MTDLNNSILESIKQHLPEVTAGELKKFIHQSEKNKSELDSAVKLIDEQIKKYNEAQKEIAELRIYKNENINLEERKKEQEKKEISLKHQEEINKAYAQAAHDKTNNMFDVLKIVFKSQPTGFAFSKTINESGSVPVQSGGYPTSMPINKNSTEYVTQTELKD